MDPEFDNEFVPIPEHDCPNPDSCQCFDWDQLYNRWIIKED